MHSNGLGAIALIAVLSAATPLQAATATSMARVHISAESVPDGVSLEYSGDVFDIDGFGIGASGAFDFGSEIDDVGGLLLEATASAWAGPAFGVAAAFSYLDGLITLANATTSAQTVMFSIIYSVQAVATVSDPVSESADAQAEITVFDGAEVPFGMMVERGISAGFGELSLNGSHVLEVLLAPGEHGRELFVVVDAFAQAGATPPATVVPLPSALPLLLGALAGLGIPGTLRRRRRALPVPRTGAAMPAT